MLQHSLPMLLDHQMDATTASPSRCLSDDVYRYPAWYDPARHDYHRARSPSADSRHPSPARDDDHSASGEGSKRPVRFVTPEPYDSPAPTSSLSRFGTVSSCRSTLPPSPKPPRRHSLFDSKFGPPTHYPRLPPYRFLSTIHSDSFISKRLEIGRPISPPSSPALEQKHLDHLDLTPRQEPSDESFDQEDSYTSEVESETASLDDVDGSDDDDDDSVPPHSPTSRSLSPPLPALPRLRSLGLHTAPLRVSPPVDNLPRHSPPRSPSLPPLLYPDQPSSPPAPSTDPDRVASHVLRKRPRTPSTESSDSSSPLRTARRRSPFSRRESPYTRGKSIDSHILTRSKQVEVAGDVPVPDDFACPFCDHVQENRRRPDLRRHIACHLQQQLGPVWACCGVPLKMAEKFGVKDTKTARTFPATGDELMVGGCGQTFSRRDAYMRHLRIAGGRHGKVNGRDGKCVGDPYGEWMLGNRGANW